MKKMYINVIYSILINIITISYPLITYPYIAKIFDLEILGKLEFSLAYMNFFLLFSNFGILNYGMREIGRIKIKEEIEEKVIRLYNVNIITTIITLVFYYIFTYNMEKLEAYLCMLLSTVVVFRIFSFEWYFRGKQNLNILFKRTLLSKIFGIIILISCVHTTEDYYKYIFTFIIPDFILSLYNIYEIEIRDKLKILKLDLLNSKNIIVLKEMYPFFLILLLTSFLKQIDIFILAKNTTDIEVSYISALKKIIGVIQNIFNAIFFIFLVNIVGELNEKTSKKYNINYLYYILIPILVIIYIFSREIVLVLFTEKFIRVVPLLKKSIFLLFLSITNSYMLIQIFIPLMREKTIMLILTFSGFIGVISSIFWVKKIGMEGIILSNYIVEGLSCFCYIICINFYKIDFQSLYPSIRYYILNMILWGVLESIIKIFEIEFWHKIILIIILELFYIRVLYFFEDTITQGLILKINRYLKNLRY